MSFRFTGFFFGSFMKLVELGQCKKAHGIKGGFVFTLLSQDSVLAKGIEILLQPLSADSKIQKSGEKYKIQNISFGNKVICYLVDVQDRNKVESLIPFKIFLDRNEFPKLKDDEFYIDDLIGLKAMDLNDSEVGKVEGHYDNGAQVVLVVRIDSELIDIPFVESFVPEVNIDKGEITVIIPEYL